MFKEADSNTLGWEGYARKDVLRVGEPANGTGEALGTGIALVADASKQLALGKDPGKMGTDISKTSLYQAIDAFTAAIGTNKDPRSDPSKAIRPRWSRTSATMPSPVRPESAATSSFTL